MPKKYYCERLTDKDLIKLFNNGAYYCDFDHGFIYSAKTKEKLYTFTNQQNTHLWTRFYSYPKMRAISIAACIWIIGTQCSIPKNFLVHHIDENPLNNAFSNLLCIHENDHKKVHLVSYQINKNLKTEVPF